ncbi:MAG: hypothetical protein ACERLM_14045 [Acidimicrobiales bacterium]
MNFRFRERVAAEAGAVFPAFSDPGFYAGLDLPDAAPEVLEIRTELDPIEADIRYRYQGDLPPGAGAFIKPERLTWVEQSLHHPDEFLIELTLVPDYYGDRMRGNATHRIMPIEPSDADPAGSDGPACWWETAGTISIRLPFVARQVERAIVEGLGQNLRSLVEPLAEYCAD